MQHTNLVDSTFPGQGASPTPHLMDRGLPGPLSPFIPFVTQKSGGLQQPSWHREQIPTLLHSLLTTEHTPMRQALLLSKLPEPHLMLCSHCSGSPRPSSSPPAPAIFLLPEGLLLPTLINSHEFSQNSQLYTPPLTSPLFHSCPSSIGCSAGGQSQGRVLPLHSSVDPKHLAQDVPQSRYPLNLRGFATVAHMPTPTCIPVPKHMETQIHLQTLPGDRRPGEMEAAGQQSLGEAGAGVQGRWGQGGAWGRGDAWVGLP